jgi:hypothetical protein
MNTQFNVQFIQTTKYKVKTITKLNKSSKQIISDINTYKNKNFPKKKKKKKKKMAGARGFGGPGGAPGFNPMAMNPMAAMLSNPAMLGLMMAQMAQAQGFPVPSAGKGKRNFEEDGDDQQDQQQHYDDEEEQDSRARNRNKGRNSQSQTGSHGNTGGRDSSSGRERGRDSGSSHTSRDRNDQKPEGLLKPPLLAQPTRPDYQARKPQTSQRQPPSDFSSSSRNQTKTQPRSVSVSLTPAFQNAAGRDRRPTGSQSSANSTNTTNNTTRAKHTPATSNSATTLQVSPAVLEKRRAAAATAAPAKTTTTGGKPDWGVKPLTNLLDTSVLGKRDREETTDAGTHSEEQADGTYDDQDQYQDQDQDQDQDQQYDDQGLLFSLLSPFSQIQSKKNESSNQDD